MDEHAYNKYAWLEVLRTEPPKRSAVDRVADFLEITTGFDETTAREQARRCIQCPKPTCVEGCPLHNRIPEWLALTAEGHFLEAAELSRSTSNLPELCSRICPQERLCEGNCILNGCSEPVSIGAIERFINEYALAHESFTSLGAPPNGFKVAVIGSGPGGIACADELSRKGYAVTVFEAQQIPGGLLVNGIPAFKLDKSLVQRRIRVLEKRGVKFRVGTRIGQDVSLAELRAEFDAVFLGIGAYQAKPLGVPGADLNGVAHALPFLIEKNVKLPLDTPPIDVAGKRVVVLGGGDTAMDCLRTAVRCGARETLCVYRRDFDNMPGSRKEYQNALDEGARFMFLTNPVALLGNAAGEVQEVRCQRMELGEPDSGGRRKPRPVPNSEFTLPADLVLVAYGFDPVRFPGSSDLSQIKVNSWGAVVVDDNQMTSVPGVFAGGDLVRGPSLAVHAVRDARKAAAAIHQHLSESVSVPP
ncbi:MAG: NAD(P)-dependent oxidoreductase [Verrucomicrobia bacterium]|nr:NAD(P)-dependent oxidoreductase [Verrucomicrobiota bacterium]